MKTKLQFLPAIFATSVPVALAAESAGLHLPPGLDTLSAFTALSVALLALTVAGDYSRLPRTPSILNPARNPKAEHPLAA
jgi:hypothetical protein